MNCYKQRALLRGTRRSLSSITPFSIINQGRGKKKKDICFLLVSQDTLASAWFSSSSPEQKKAFQRPGTPAQLAARDERPGTALHGRRRRWWPSTRDHGRLSATGCDRHRGLWPATSSGPQQRRSPGSTGADTSGEGRRGQKCSCWRGPTRVTESSWRTASRAHRDERCPNAGLQTWLKK